MPALVIPRESFFVPARDRHVDALASLRAMPTPVLAGELAEHRRLARSRVYWLDGTLGAMRVRRVLRERGHATTER